MIREYRVRPVTRYIVTEFTEAPTDVGGIRRQVRSVGEFDNLEMAREAAEGLVALNGGYLAKPMAAAVNEMHAIMADIPTFVDGDVIKLVERPAVT